MRSLYSLLFYAIVPFILIRLIWRGFKSRGYWQRWPERFAFYQGAALAETIWIHAVSVGEVEAVFPLLKRLREIYPEQHFVLTCMTPTGSGRIETVVSDKVSHVYLPYDMPDAVSRFLRFFRPKMAIIMETEIWPNLFAACAAQKIPLFIVNARLSESSVAQYCKVRPLVKAVLSQVTLIAAQSEQDAQKFIAIGAEPERAKVIGNIKFDLPPLDDLKTQAQALRQQLFTDRFVWIIASTHETEEAFFIELFPKLKLLAPNLLLLIAPRHPERFPQVGELCLKAGLSVAQRSEGIKRPVHEEIYLADTLGELKMLYGCADLAFVGGSLKPIGGHNVLEPAAMGVPVITGPYTANFKQIVEGMLKHEALIQCQNTTASLYESFEKLYRNHTMRESIARNAQGFVESNRGACDKLVASLQTALVN